MSVVLVESLFPGLSCDYMEAQVTEAVCFWDGSIIEEYCRSGFASKGEKYISGFPFIKLYMPVFIPFGYLQFL